MRQDETTSTRPVPDPPEVFHDPVGYLLRFGIVAELVGDALPNAA